MARYMSSCSCSSSSSKRQKLNHDRYAIIRSSNPRRKQHLYLALDDWNGGYSIHKIDADEIMDDDDDEAATAAASATDREQLHKLPERAAVRLASPVVGCRMAFAAMGTNIFVATNPRCRYDDAAPKLLVYDAATGALSGGPHLPDQERLYDFGAAMAVGERLYTLTSVCLELNECPSFRALSWEPTTRPGRGLGVWDPRMEWSWSCVPPPRFHGFDIAAYALHPDGRTIFISTAHHSTHSFDTSSGVWTELGDWVLPFRGQAYFDAELDAWVGLHHKEGGYVC
jgi:hypothetical protein